MRTETININNKEYKLRVGFGVMMEFEEEFNKPISSIKSTKEITKLIYITLKYNNEDFNISYKEFVDEILDYNPELISIITKLLFKGSNESEGDKKK
jgi:hypothetical protein